MRTIPRRLLWPMLVCSVIGAVFTACVSTTYVTFNPPAVPEAEFVGTQTCADCHEGIVADFATAAHSALVVEGFASPGSLGCEACHGPGSAHVDSGGEVRDIVNPGRAATVCTQCHLNTVAEFDLPSGHPVKTGQMACIDCHDPHTGRHDALATVDFNHAPADLSCVECHPTQGGPFVFAHEASRSGCVTCHLPHGSVNAKLLRTRNSNLCLNCHVQQPTSTGALRIGTVDHRNFVNQGTCWSSGCHEAVHGSHVNSHLRY